MFEDGLPVTYSQGKFLNDCFIDHMTVSAVGPGFYPPAMHKLSVPKDPEQWDVDPLYSVTHNLETMAKIKGIRQGKKYNLMTQVIPLYGFGILLYIVYIIHKVISLADL